MLNGTEGEATPPIESVVQDDAGEILKLLNKLAPRKYQLMLPIEEIVDWIVNDDEKAGKFLTYEEIVECVDKMSEKSENTVKDANESAAQEEETIDLDEYLKDIEEFYQLKQQMLSANLDENEVEIENACYSDSSTNSDNVTISEDSFSESSHNLNSNQSSNDSGIDSSGGNDVLYHLGEIEKYCIQNKINYFPLVKIRKDVLEKLYS